MYLIGEIVSIELLLYVKNHILSILLVLSDSVKTRVDGITLTISIGIRCDEHRQLGITFQFLKLKPATKMKCQKAWKAIRSFICRGLQKRYEEHDFALSKHVSQL